MHVQLRCASFEVKTTSCYTLLNIVHKCSCTCLYWCALWLLTGIPKRIHKQVQVLSLHFKLLCKEQQDKNDTKVCGVVTDWGLYDALPTRKFSSSQHQIRHYTLTERVSLPANSQSKSNLLMPWGEPGTILSIVCNNMNITKVRTVLYNFILQ